MAKNKTQFLGDPQYQALLQLAGLTSESQGPIPMGSPPAEAAPPPPPPNPGAKPQPAAPPADSPSTTGLGELPSLEGFSPEDRQAAAGVASQGRLAANLGSAFTPLLSAVSPRVGQAQQVQDARFGQQAGGRMQEFDQAAKMAAQERDARRQDLFKRLAAKRGEEQLGLNRMTAESQVAATDERLAASQQKRGMLAEANTPESEISARARDRLRQLYPQYADRIPEDLTAADAAEVHQTLMSREGNAAALQRKRIGANAAMTAARHSAAGLNDNQFANQLRDYGKFLDKKGIPQANKAIADLERELGSSLEDIEVREGRVILGGQEQDIPGFNVPGLGRVQTFSSPMSVLKGPNAPANTKSRQLGMTIQRITNSLLRTEAGLNQTQAEELRQLRAQGQKGFNNDGELVQALKDTKRLMGEIKENIDRSYYPQVVDFYNQRGSGGPASPPTSPPSPDGAVMMEAPDGTRMPVRPEAVEKYKRKGAKVIQ